MPYNTSWLRFLSFAALAMTSMGAGSQCVHNIYKPLDDLEDLIEEAFQKRLSQQPQIS